MATNNPKKRRELEQLLSGTAIEIVAPGDLGLRLDVEETGESFEANAALKADAAWRLSGLPSIADDSGLEIDALGGEPGVYSARYAGAAATDRQRYERVLARMRAVPERSRTARFVAAVALAGLTAETQMFRGDVEGLITTRPRGRGGFGYDPIFLHTPTGRTFAEMSSQEKARVSHRGRALAELLRYLKSHGYT